VKFIILCYPRSGSTLLMTALGAHPRISQGMEIFNPVLEGDDPWVYWRTATFSTLYCEHETYLNQYGYIDGKRFDLSLLLRLFFKEFDCTKIMYDQIDPHSQVWEYLESLADVRVIVLRRNIIEAAVSFRIAMDSNVWHIPTKNSYIWYYPDQEANPTSPSLVYQCEYFEWFFNHFCALEEFCVSKFRNHETIFVDYHEMVSDWANVIRALQLHVGVNPVDIPMMFKKRTHGTIQELISNYDEILSFYKDHPILAHQFDLTSS